MATQAIKGRKAPDDSWIASLTLAMRPLVRRKCNTLCIPAFAGMTRYRDGELLA
ncbi:MAG TPA: hypothetical protein VFE60_19395 [Roseiarcus sp.]|jgi:hypothetical protein|nr:hypothetical protein [Roseiarcus sp.]